MSPFKAVGRDFERTRDVVAHVPGVDTIEHGHVLAETLPAVGAHYLDTTGEHDWVLEAQQCWGEQFAEADLLLPPGIAHMYTTDEIAANIALETPGMETLDILLLTRECVVPGELLGVLRAQRAGAQARSLHLRLMGSLTDYLDKGASLGRDAPCLVEGDRSLSYGDVQDLSHRVAGALARDGIEPGAKVGILSSNNAVAFACVFGIARRGAVWCPINPRNEIAENYALLELFDCECLIYHAAYAPMVEQLDLRIRVCLDELDDWLDVPGGAAELENDLAMLVGTGGTTGLPKGVMLTSRNLETMTALTLMGYPLSGRPAYLALAPLTHAAGVLCFPVMTQGGRIVVMPKPDVGEFIALIERERITHTFLPPTLVYMLLAHEAISTTDLSSLQCFWYGAAPMSTARLEEAMRMIGPMAQLFGQTEAPMMVSMLSPAEHYNADGTVATKRLASAGRPAPLVTVGIMDPDTGRLLSAGERGEIVVRGSLVMAGYYKNPEATEAASTYGWHHTGDVGYLDEDGYLFIVDRLKDMIITGGFNVYSAEVEQALMQHPAVRDCAVVGLPDDKWGERVTAVIESSAEVQPDELVAFVKARIGSVKAPKRVELWQELPRSRVGKVLKADVRTQLLHDQGPRRP